MNEFWDNAVRTSNIQMICIGVMVFAVLLFVFGMWAWDKFLGRK